MKEKIVEIINACMNAYIHTLIINLKRIWFDAENNVSPAYEGEFFTFESDIRTALYNTYE